MFEIRFACGRVDDAETLDEACDTVGDIFPDAFMTIDCQKFVVPFVGGLATVAELTVV